MLGERRCRVDFKVPITRLIGTQDDFRVADKSLEQFLENGV